MLLGNKLFYFGWSPPTRRFTITTITRSTATLSSIYRNLYLHWRDSTVSACRTPRTCSSADDCQRCTWCRPTKAHPVPPDHCYSRSSAVPTAMPVVDSVGAVVADSMVSSAMIGRYKCPGKTLRWSRPMVLESTSYLLRIAPNFVRDSVIGNKYLVCPTIDRLHRPICRIRPAAYIFRSSAFFSAPVKIASLKQKRYQSSRLHVLEEIPRDPPVVLMPALLSSLLRVVPFQPLAPWQASPS